MEVRPEFQRRGFGQIVLEKLKDTALRLGYTELCLDTTAQNIRAKKLYEKFGFVEVRRRKMDCLDVIFCE